METLIEQPKKASSIVREAVARMLSSTSRGFSPEQSKALREFELSFEGSIQSGHPSGDLIDEEG